MEQCFDCGADTAGQRACPSCNLPLTTEVASLHDRLTSATKRASLLQGTFAISVLLAFGIGAGISALVSSPRSEIIAEAERVEEALAEPLSIRAVNGMYMDHMEERLGLGFRGWTQHPSGTVIFELEPPTRENPYTVWEALDQDERREIAELIAAGYTIALFNTGNPVNVETDGHPPVALRYAGTEAPVAVRTKDGTVRIYPSPFAQH